MKYIKDPQAVLDYGFDWSEWLASGEVITESTWTVSTGVTSSDPASTATTTSVRLSGGTIGVTYLVTNKITTSAGQEDERTLQIRVQQR